MPKRARRTDPRGNATTGKLRRSTSQQSARAASAPATAPSRAEVDAYHNFLLETTSSADVSRLSFGAIYPRTTNRREQSEQYRSYLDDAERAYTHLWKRGAVVDPASLIFKIVNRDHKLLEVKGENSYLYFEEVLGKSGIACSGGSRTDGYIAQFTREGRLQDPMLRASIDFDNMAEVMQRETTDLVLDIAAKHACKVYPKTLADVLALDISGLPAPTQMTFRSITKEYEECKGCGGAVKVYGVLLANVRNMIESGQQVSLRKRGISITGDCHESANNDLVRRAVQVDRKVCRNVDKCLRKILSKEERKVAKERSIKPRKPLLAWKPARLKSCPPNYEEAKGMIATKVFGHYDDAFDGPPTDNPQTIDDCFDAEDGYDEEDCERARGKTIGEICHIELDGGGGGMDENKRGWKDTEAGSLVKYLVEERETLLGHAAGSGWFVAWTSKGITVLKLEWDGDDLIRIIVVFVPWCKMIFSKGGEQIEWSDLVAHERAAMSAHWAYNFFKLLGEVDSTLVTDKSLDRLLEDNIIFLFYCGYVNDLKINKYASKPSALHFKKRLGGESLNAYDLSFTNMIRTRDLDIFGVNIRRRLARFAGEDVVDSEDDEEDGIVSEEDAAVVRDNKMVWHAMALASYECHTIDELAQSLLHSIENDRLGIYGEIGSGVANKRFNNIMDHDDLFLSELLERVEEIYKSTRQNYGNTTCHSSVTKPDIEGVDALLTYYAQTGEKFFVQGDGKAKEKTNGKYPDGSMLGTTFVQPIDGTMLEVEPGKDFDPVSFRASDFVQLTYNGLVERLKPPNGPGNTNKTDQSSRVESKNNWSDCCIDYLRHSSSAICFSVERQYE